MLTWGQVPVFDVPQPKAKLLSIEIPSPVTSTQHKPVAYTFTPDQRVQHRQIMAEVESFEKMKAQKEQRVQEALSTLDGNRIYYEFPSQPDRAKSRYHAAFHELTQMLSGQKALDLKRAVYLVESAYDTTLQYGSFNRQLGDIAYILGLKMKQERIKPSDNVGKILTIYQYMTDTIKVKSPALEKTITTFPKTYDFEDFWGRKDYRKMLVSKLINKGSGQCHSLPLLFLLLAEEIGADTHLAFAPNHSFIKFQDKKGRWHNIELTTGVFASDHFMIESGYIKAEALQSKIYLEPISKPDVIAQCLNDLAGGYSRTFGYDKFTLECSTTVLRYVPNSLSAHQIASNYYNSLLEYVARQYIQQGRKQSEFRQDGTAMSIYQQAENAIRKIESLGYSEMPAEAYEAWLASCKEEAARQEHLNNIAVLKGMIQK